MIEDNTIFVLPGVDLLIVAELHEGVQLAPRFGVICAEYSEVDLQFLINAFGLSISLRVVGSTTERFES